MTWGGLRGGISIALALSVSGQYHNFIVAITYVVVLFSMLIQGVTISPLLKARMPTGANRRKVNVTASSTEITTEKNLSNS